MRELDSDEQLDADAFSYRTKDQPRKLITCEVMNKLGDGARQGRGRRRDAVRTVPGRQAGLV